MRRTARVVLTVVIGMAGVPVAPAPAQESTPSLLSVSHDPITCMVAGQHPQVDASLVPDPQVQSARVFFHSALDSTFYYVEMARIGGRFVGTLPSPNMNAGPVTYYVDGVSFDYTQTQAPEVHSTVVEKESDCDGRVAAWVPSGPVTVYSTAGATALPPGFTGVGSVIAAGGGAAAAAAPAVAAGGGFLTSTAGLVLIGAAAVGVTTLVVVTTGDDESPASPSR